MGKRLAKVTGSEFSLLFCLKSSFSKITSNAEGVDGYCSRICLLCFHLVTRSVVILHSIIHIHQDYSTGKSCTQPTATCPTPYKHLVVQEIILWFDPCNRLCLRDWLRRMKLFSGYQNYCDLSDNDI